MLTHWTIDEPTKCELCGASALAQWGNLRLIRKSPKGAFEHLLSIQSGMMIVCNGLIFFCMSWIELNWTMLKPTTTYSILHYSFRYASIHFLGTQCWPITLPMHQVVCAVKFGVAKQLFIGRRCSTLLPLVGYIGLRAWAAVHLWFWCSPEYPGFWAIVACSLLSHSGASGKCSKQFGNAADGHLWGRW